MNKEKLTVIKNKIKDHSPELISATIAILSIAVVVQTKKNFRLHEKELLSFIGEGPDFISIDRIRAEEIKNGKVFGYDLENGTRILISKAAQNK